MTVQPAGDWGVLYDNAPVGLAELDAEFRILSANRYLLELAGASRDRPVVGERLQSLLSPAGRIYLQTRLQQELSLSGRMDELALDVVQPDGARTPAMLNLVQTADAAGRPHRIQMAIWRAAAKRAYEAEVPKARLAAQEAERVKADFLANISHEMRTPLNGVVSVATVLGGTGLDAEQRQMVEIIRASGDSLARMFSDLLDLSNVRAGKLTLEARPFDLTEALAGVIGAAHLKAEAKGLALVATVSPAAARRYLGDAVRVKQVLEALLSNAVKFTDQGGVTLAIEHDEAGRLAITVSDTGIGFDEATAAALFEDFAQAENGISRVYAGAGAGLSIAQGLVALMGGRIDASSTPGVGSRFRVTLPLAVAETEEEPVRPDNDGRPVRILLVEDNPTNQRVVQMILGAADVDLAIADNGKIGLDAWSDGAFDVVLMDLQMPVMDGLTAIRAIRTLEARDPSRGRTPIIVLSANAMDHHRREAAEAGADRHVAKPISPETLLVAIMDELQPDPVAAVRTA